MVAGVRREQRQDLSVYRFERLPVNAIAQLVSTRTGGVSTGPYASLNLGLRVEDDEARVLENRRKLFDAFDLPLDRSVWCRQVHGDGVHVVASRDVEPRADGRRDRGGFDETTVIDATDALVTELPQVPLCVTLADCVPVVLYDAEHHAIGLAHAGWGGTVARICTRTVETMTREYGTDPTVLVGGIGPSISPTRYAVGSDVVARARDAYGDDAGRILHDSEEPGKAVFDLWEANLIDLESAGVARDNVEVSGISTIDALDEFYSHRAEKPTGRLIAAVMLRDV
jgi:polyphenol oxidase